MLVFSQTLQDAAHRTYQHSQGIPFFSDFMLELICHLVVTYGQLIIKQTRIPLNLKMWWSVNTAICCSLRIWLVICGSILLNPVPSRCVNSIWFNTERGKCFSYAHTHQNLQARRVHPIPQCYSLTLRRVIMKFMFVFTPVVHILFIYKTK